jgi:hypothetical protein
VTKQESIDMVSEVYERAGCPDLYISNSYGADSLAMVLAMEEAGIPMKKYPHFSYYWPVGEKADLLPWQQQYRDYIDKELGIKSKFFPSHLYLHAKSQRFLHDPVGEMVSNDFSGTKNEIGFYSRDQIEFICKASYGEINKKASTAVGIKVGDSMPRRKALNSCRGVSGDKIYPIWRYEKGDVVSVIERHGIKVSYDYELFGISFESPFFHYEFIPLMNKEKEIWGEMCKEFHFLPIHAARFFRYYPERANYREKIKKLQFKKRGMIYGYER